MLFINYIIGNIRVSIVLLYLMDMQFIKCNINIIIFYIINLQNTDNMNNFFLLNDNNGS